MYFFAEANIIELCLYISLYTKERMNYMAKSQAKKHRKKLLRETGYDTTIRRGSWGNINLLTKMTKTKQELLIKDSKKYRKNHSHVIKEDRFFNIFLF